jgi:F420-0:gamma-glutamyl ligase
VKETSYMKKMNETEALLEGLYHNKERLRECGITSEVIAKLEGIHHSLYELNICQEALEARLKAKTAEINRQVIELDNVYRKVSEVVKVELPEDSWHDFGIGECDQLV